jgi:hypothetical protein
VPTAYLIPAILWLIVNASLAIYAGFRYPPDQPRARTARRNWFVFAALLLILAIAQWRDLFGQLTDKGRFLALANGWYWHRGPTQELAIQAILIVGMVLILGLVVLRKHPNPGWDWIALPFLIILIAFLVIQSISLHDVDGLLSRRYRGIALRWILEYVCLAGISLGAGISVLQAPRVAPAPQPQ